MLTVKHVEKDGHESLVPCTSAQFYPAVVGDDATRPKVEVFGSPADGGAFYDGHATYSNGKIYVMNDHGATVGNYDLD